MTPMEVETQGIQGPEPEVATLAVKDEKCTLEIVELGGDAVKVNFTRGAKLGAVLRGAGVDPAGKTVQMNAITIADPEAEEAKPDSYVCVVGEVHNG